MGKRGRGRGGRGGRGRGRGAGGSVTRSRSSSPEPGEPSGRSFSRRTVSSNHHRYEEPISRPGDEYTEEAELETQQAEQADLEEFQRLLNLPFSALKNQYRPDPELDYNAPGVLKFDESSSMFGKCGVTFDSVPLHLRLNIDPSHLTSETVEMFAKEAEQKSSEPAAASAKGDISPNIRDLLAFSVAGKALTDTLLGLRSGDTPKTTATEEDTSETREQPACTESTENQLQRVTDGSSTVLSDSLAKGIHSSGVEGCLANTDSTGSRSPNVKAQTPSEDSTTVWSSADSSFLEGGAAASSTKSKSSAMGTLDSVPLSDVSKPTAEQVTASQAKSVFVPLDDSDLEDLLLELPTVSRPVVPRIKAPLADDRASSKPHMVSRSSSAAESKPVFTGHLAATLAIAQASDKTTSGTGVAEAERDDELDFLLGL